MDYSQARFALVGTVNEFLAKSLKTLLEEKHLYQSSAPLDFDKTYDVFFKQLVGSTNQSIFSESARLLSDEWFTPSEVLLSGVDSSRKGPIPTLLVQNIKLYCSRCKQAETFSPTSYVDISRSIAERHASDHRIAGPPEHYQLYTLTFQCETCKEIPVSFLVRRREWKLTLEGRSPFEAVVLPPFIPKTESWLLSDAIVASQSSKTLAGLFYLRSFIEQFARRQTGIKDRRTGEEILDAYQALLPEGKRDHMPSLRSCYEKLSAAVHEASSDDSVFEQAIKTIIEHFDFRRIYNIPEQGMAASA
jgi:hypothetical protein